MLCIPVIDNGQHLFLHMSLKPQPKSIQKTQSGLDYINISILVPAASIDFIPTKL